MDAQENHAPHRLPRRRPGEDGGTQRAHVRPALAHRQQLDPASGARHLDLPQRNRPRHRRARGGRQAPSADRSQERDHPEVRRLGGG